MVHSTVFSDARSCARLNDRDSTCVHVSVCMRANTKFPHDSIPSPSDSTVTQTKRSRRERTVKIDWNRRRESGVDWNRLVTIFWSFPGYEETLTGIDGERAALTGTDSENQRRRLAAGRPGVSVGNSRESRSCWWIRSKGALTTHSHELAVRERGSNREGDGIIIIIVVVFFFFVHIKCLSLRRM